jgi:tetratricopeptide (TPR) repeat protein
MDFVWLQMGAVSALVAGAEWAGRQPPGTLASVGGVVALFGVALLARRRRRRFMQRLARKRQVDVTLLKDRLRCRLGEPGLFAHQAAGEPTLGASQAFERDLEAGCEALLEAGGDQAQAAALLRRCIAEKAADAREQGMYWRRLGALSLIDNLREAGAAYSRAAELSPDDPDVHMLYGVLQLRIGNLGAAADAFERHIALALSRGDEIEQYRGTAMSGDVRAAEDQLQQALASYEAAARQIEVLLERESDDAGRQRDLSLVCDRIGDVRAARGELDDALAAYQRGLACAQAVANQEPENIGRQRDISVSHDRIAEIQERLGDLAGALESYRRSLAIAERLARIDPDNAQWQSDLAVTHDRVGDILLAEGKPQDALISYRRGLAIAEDLVGRHPVDPMRQRDFAVSCYKVGSIEAMQGEPEAARVLLERGRAAIARLVLIAEHGAQWRRDLARFDEILRQL